MPRSGSRRAKFNMSFRPKFAPQIPVAPHHWVIGIVGSRLLLRRQDQALLIRYEEFLAADLEPAEVMHLGDWQGTPCFALLFATDFALSDVSPFIVAGLRSRLGVVSDEIFLLAGRAQQLAHWQEFHRFCGRCGRPTQAQLHERVLACGACGALYYPRIAPCVIGIVVRGDECLLAHNARFADGLYSVLAGFIEPGETAEQALLREIREETGIEAGELEYVCSQPWPFPSQLMLGFIARYHSGDIVVDGVEITHAQWFTAHNLPQIPPPHTISGKLIEIFAQRSQAQD